MNGLDEQARQYFANEADAHQRCADSYQLLAHVNANSPLVAERYANLADTERELSRMYARAVELFDIVRLA